MIVRNADDLIMADHGLRESFLEDQDLFRTITPVENRSMITRVTGDPILLDYAL